MGIILRIRVVRERIVGVALGRWIGMGAACGVGEFNTRASNGFGVAALVLSLSLSVVASTLESI